MKIENLFEENAKKHGKVICGGVEIALLENPRPEHSFYDWYFRVSASGMDKNGNLWVVCWSVSPSVFSYADFADWDNPSYAELVAEGYFLDS